MEILFSNLGFTIPIKQLIIIAIINILFTFWGKFKSAMLVNISFIFYWTCVACKSGISIKGISSHINYAMVASMIIFMIALLIFYEMFE